MSPKLFKRKVECSMFPKFGELPLELQLQIWYFACLETPYNPDDEEGKLWQGFQAFGYDLVPQERQNVHVLRPIASLPTWKEANEAFQATSHCKRNRHNCHQCPPNSRPLRTCRQSRLALMEKYDLTSTWNTFVNFDTDIFFFDIRWTGFLLSQHVCTRPVPQHLMLQYPEVMAQIKNLAIVNEFLGTLLSMGTFTGVDFNTFLEYDRSVKPLLKSVEKIFIIGHTIHCDNVLSVEETGCESWELGELRYMEEPIRCIRFATRRFCLAKQRTGISCRQCWTNMERETGSSLCGLLRGSLFA
ncbi:hypothetical protein IFR04_007517 [Cadophora malorum]|uniref:2EXR domain-containing protein n=1 Tax=Cadophora malorum TaxID=108018 RepID=A0A8H7WAZ2_9HELO|nr:hypothetical protein IFR04_007517 [Cadophora malorum]